MAGITAEAILTGRHNWRGASADREGSYDLALRCFRDVGAGGEISSAYLKYIKLCVRNQLQSSLNWPSVEAVAKALLEHRRLGYKKTRAIIFHTKEKPIEEAMAKYRKIKGGEL